MQSSSSYYRLALFATFLALVVVMLGAYTRLADAGLGCPDWPGCYGYLTVPSTPVEVAQAEAAYNQVLEPAKAWKEMVHRYLAGILGIIIAILAAWGIKRRFIDAEQPIGVPIFLMLFVIFQAALGMWTVTWLVLPLIVTAHLLGGMIITGLLWYLTLTTRPHHPYTHVNTKFKPWVMLGLVILMIQIFLGAWTSTNYAAIICPTFPYCYGKFIPVMDFKTAFYFFHPIGVNYEGGVLETTARVTIQMTHRYGAIITAAYLGILSLALIGSKGLKKLGWILLTLIALQFCLGIVNIVWMLPMSAAVLHNGVAAILVITMVTIIYKLFRKAP